MKARGFSPPRATLGAARTPGCLPGAAGLLRAEQQERGQQPGQRVHGLGARRWTGDGAEVPPVAGAREVASPAAAVAAQAGREREGARRGREGGRSAEPRARPAPNRAAPRRRPARPPPPAAQPAALRSRADSSPPPSLAAAPRLQLPPGLAAPPSPGVGHSRSASLLRGRRPSPATLLVAASRCPAGRLQTDGRGDPRPRGCLWGTQVPGTWFRHLRSVARGGG